MEHNFANSIADEDGGGPHPQCTTCCHGRSGGRSDSSGGRGFGGGVMIATSKSYDDDAGAVGGWPGVGQCDDGLPISSDAEATLSLLQVDDEYDARHHHSTSTSAALTSSPSYYNHHHSTCHQRGGYRHYTPSSQSGEQISPVRNDSGGGVHHHLGLGGGHDPTTCAKQRQHNGAEAASGTQHRIGVPSECEATSALAGLSYADDGDAAADGLWTRRARMSRGSMDESGCDGGEVLMRDNPAAASGPPPDDGMMGDDIHWRVDFEEEEARARLEKALRDQQRFRQEELMELQRVYTKALRKNFRSIKGMPEPSFDTPTALYEEELDALDEVGDAAPFGRPHDHNHPHGVPHHDCLSGSLSSSQPSPPAEALLGPPGAQHQRRCFAGPIPTSTIGNGAAALQRLHDDASLAEGTSVSAVRGLPSVDAAQSPSGAVSAAYALHLQQHADCQDERAMAVVAMRSRCFPDNSAGGTGEGDRPVVSCTSPFEGTHIHTTHGGGTHGGGGVAAGGFVNRLRRRTDAGEEVSSLRMQGATLLPCDEE